MKSSWEWELWIFMALSILTQFGFKPDWNRLVAKENVSCFLLLLILHNCIIRKRIKYMLNRYFFNVWLSSSMLFSNKPAQNLHRHNSDHFIVTLWILAHTISILRYYLGSKSFKSVKVLVAQSWLTVTPWTVAHQVFVHGIFQARILEWVAIPFSRESFRPRDRTREILYHLIFIVIVI